MKISRPILTILIVVLLFAGSRSAFAAPAAPTPSAPASGATVAEPFTIAWSSVSDPSGIVGYNWEVSPSSSFSSVIRLNSTNGATQDAVSGLANGTYFWRVQAVNGAFEQGAWSQARSFTVSGTAAGVPPPPTLAPTKAYSTFHPYEVMTFTWSASQGAASYLLQASTDPSFPVATLIQFDNIPNTTFSFAIGNPEGNYFARILAVDANGIRGQPSNSISFSVFFNNPIGPAPSSVSPSGVTLTLPATFTWTDVPNPQPSGYELQVASDSGFKNLDFMYNQITDPTYTLTSLTSGTKFWRVRSAQGDASPTTAAETAWSAVRTFTVSTAPPTPVSVTFTSDPLASGNTTWVAVQLTAAVPAGTSIALTSSNPGAAPVPASVQMIGNAGWMQFQMQAGQVVSPTAATITATLNGKSAAGQITIAPTALKSLTISPSTITGGGAQPGGIVMLTGEAPPGGASVTLSSDSPAVTPPASVFVPAGSPSVSFPIPTSAVASNTTATITASWNGTTVQSTVTLTPQQHPASLTLSPTSTVGQSGGSFATVTIASAQSTDLTLQVMSSNPAVASVPTAVTIPAGSTTGGFNVFTTAVTTQTVVTISVSGGGTTQSAALTVTPSASSPPPAQSATLTVSATGRSGELVTSSPAGISVGVGSTRSATFSSGTSITLSVSNGRSAVWSGACSSGGNKQKTCTFTLSANASVTANVQ
jgi:hypothetical protein